ncbi:VanZ family protein [Oceanobacillus alkalisoli]|uniref:VanZ family protein n=1 Tax=Oceanobacillus alkalisoli TaxID=2925113 RepID=UPI001F121A32|nr:VanZ family protein [Oceanobacillus alkalisoli]MCF3943430.1 VanZ family protein [Oceanobacillus alkalisoli]
MDKKYLYWLFPILWMGIIFYSSATPYEQQDMKPFLGESVNLEFLEPLADEVRFTYNESIVSIETHGVEGIVEFFIRKGAHVFVFFILTLLFKLAFDKTTEMRFQNQVLLSFLLTAAYAIMDEIHQGFTPNRTAYMGDVFLDSMGSLIAVVLLIIIRKINWSK